MDIAVDNLTKTFGSLRANDGVGLRFAGGQIHGVLGENGAGKSTLMKLLSGFLRPDAGEIRLDGKAVSLGDPGAALRAGVGMVHQEPLDIPAFTALENLACAAPRWALPTRAEARATLTVLAGRLGFSVEPDDPITRLTVGQRQQLEIIRLLACGARAMILDEPTTGITAAQTRALFTALRKLAAEGNTVLFVSHKLDEVADLCHTVSVLRAGRLVEPGQMVMPQPQERLVEMMFGGGVQNDAARDDRRGGSRADPPPSPLPHPSTPTSAPSDALHGLGLSKPAEGWPALVKGHTPSPTPGFDQLSQRPPWPALAEGHAQSPNLAWQMEDVTVRDGGMALRVGRLAIPAGAVVGLAGLDGSGQQILLKLLAGRLRPDGGRLRLVGADMDGAPPVAFRDAGVEYLPADRLADGMVGALSLSEHFALLQPAGALVDRKAAEARARQAIADYGIKATPVTPIAALSGGNQQRAMLALIPDHCIGLVCEQPTRGLDVNSAQAIWGRLAARRNAGCAVVFASFDLDEIMDHSDYVLVFFAGKISPLLPRAELSAGRLAELIGGVGFAWQT